MSISGPHRFRFFVLAVMSIVLVSGDSYGHGELGTRPVTKPLPDGVVGREYSGSVADQAQELPATIDTHRAPFVFEIEPSSLPKGLTLNTSTGAVSGTPACIGTWFFRARITDSCATPHTARIRSTTISAIKPAIIQKMIVSMMGLRIIRQ